MQSPGLRQSDLGHEFASLENGFTALITLNSVRAHFRNILTVQGLSVNHSQISQLLIKTGGAEWVHWDTISSPTKLAGFVTAAIP